MLEDVPGVGKTVLARTISVSLGADLSRVQGHPDLLPTDVTGVSVYSQETGSWEFRRGPVFSHVVLVDELNRTPPRTQSALLEAMEEQQVSSDGTSWPLPRPHLVIATQNPVGQLGTYPLVESQLDRFSLSTPLGYPTADLETQLALRHGGREALDALLAICTVERWSEVIDTTRNIYVHPSVAEYAVEITRRTRGAPGVRLGASPRASISLVRSAQAHALLYGRNFVSPVDIQAMSFPGLSHRLLTDSGRSSRSVVAEVVNSVPAPRP